VDGRVRQRADCHQLNKVNPAVGIQMHDIEMFFVLINRIFQLQ
jgi:hypothetical protein